MSTPYGIDPDEWAEAAYDATITGGGSEAEAVAAADQARAYITDPARANDDRFVLRNTTEDIRQWAAELASAKGEQPAVEPETHQADADDSADGW